MTLPGHVAAGIITAALTRSPIAGVAAGLFSHVVLDYGLAEHRLNWQDRRELRRHATWVAWWVVSSSALVILAWPWAAWSLIGSLAPDVIDGAYSLLRPAAWNAGKLLMPWHRAKGQVVDLSLPWTFAIEVIFIAVALTIIVVNQGEVVSMDDVTHYFREAFEKLFYSPAWKMVAGLFLGLIHVLFGEVARNTYVPIIVLCIFDFILGFLLAVMKKNVSSQRLVRGAVKLAIYANIIAIGTQFLRTQNPFLIGLTGFLDTYVVLAESTSVLEKLSDLADRYGIELPILDKILKLLQRKQDALGGNEVEEMASDR